jgi:hypothetical protein
MGLKRRIISIAAAAFLLALALSACGGGDDSSAASDAPQGGPGIVSRQQFIDKSKAVCRKWREKVNKGLKDLYRKRTAETGAAEGSVGTIESMRVVVVPAMRRQLTEMEQVGLPKENEYAAEEFWDAIRRMTNEIEAEGIFAWTRESTIFPIHKLGKQFQLQNCVYF